MRWDIVRTRNLPPARTAFANGHIYNSCMVLSSRFEETDSWMMLPSSAYVGFRCVSCSYATQCFAQAWRPLLCRPRMVSSIATPVRYGSGLKPSQLRPAYADLPRGPATGLQKRVSRLCHVERHSLPKSNMSSLPLEFCTHEYSSLMYQVSIKGCCS
jgi:hypothetical protein